MSITDDILEVRLFGGLELRNCGEVAALPTSKKTRALLAYLILSPRGQARDRLSSLFFGSNDDPKAALRWSLSKLRPCVNSGGVKRLRSEGPLLVFAQDTCSIDYDCVRQAASEAFARCSPPTLALWSDGLERGFLADLDLPDCPDYQAWLVAHRAELETVRDALRRLTRRDVPSVRMADRPALAVLPFDNLSGNPEDDYFADGLAEDLITALSQWRSFPVIARNSSFTYKGMNVRTQTVGAELGARYLLEGSVRRAGEMVRVNAKLVDAECAVCLWAEKVDRNVKDVFSLQDEITSRVLKAIAPKLNQAEWTRISAKRSKDLTAWDYYMRGMELYHRETRETNNRAREMLVLATEHDPDYAEAWARLAWTHVRDIDLRLTSDRAHSAGQAIELASHALSLDDGSAVAHLCLGTAYVWKEEVERGLAQAERALELDPNYAHAAMAVGNRLDLLGHSERGIEQMTASLALNPRDPNRWHYMGYLSRAYGAMSDAESALAWAEKALLLRPEDAEVHFRLALYLAQLDRVEDARRALAKCDELEPTYVSKHRQWAPYAAPARNAALFAGVTRHQLLSQG